MKKTKIPLLEHCQNSNEKSYQVYSYLFEQRVVFNT